MKTYTEPQLDKSTLPLDGEKVLFSIDEDEDDYIGVFDSENNQFTVNSHKWFSSFEVIKWKPYEIETGNDRLKKILELSREIGGTMQVVYNNDGNVTDIKGYGYINKAINDFTISVVKKSETISHVVITLEN